MLNKKRTASSKLKIGKEKECVSTKTRHILPTNSITYERGKKLGNLYMKIIKNTSKQLKI